MGKPGLQVPPYFQGYTLWPNNACSTILRRDQLRHAVKQAGVDALLVTNFTNVTYLTGFTGDDSYLLLHGEGQVMLSDSRYTTQLSEESPDIEAYSRPHTMTMLQSVVRALRSLKIGRLGIEADSMTVSLRDQIAKASPKVELVATSGLVEKLRQIKDKDEVARLRTAAWQARRAFEVLRATLNPEKTEIQVANELEHQMRLFGSKCRGFQSIVGVGPRAALPHAVPSQRRVGESDFVLVDWGANEGLYISDLTRVLVTGKIVPKFERIYRVVLEAQTRAIAAIRPGAAAKDIDRIARDYIADAGFGRYFGHGLGHGLGLEVHEAPRLAAKSEAILRPGMVVTVEPGIYLPGWGGVRIEDDILVTRKGHDVLTDVPKQLEDAIVR